MADVTLTYKGSDILELSDSGSATLKTGGTYCEADIELEYVKPSGGGSGLKLLVEHTTTEDVSSIKIDFTQEMLDSAGLLFVMNGTTSANEWIYPSFDTTNKTSLYLPQKQNYQNYFVSAFRPMSGSNFIMTNQTVSNNIRSASPTYIYFQLYNVSSVFNSGFNIKVYGVTLP